MKKERNRRALPDLEPASVEEELEQGEDGDVEVEVVTWVTPARVQKLPANQTRQEEAVHR